MSNKLISSVQINQSNMSSSSQTRSLKVVGEVGSSFIVNVVKINSTSKESYYNFKTNAFTEAFVAANNLNVTMTGTKISIPIIFPADTNGETYSVLVIPKTGTELNNNAGAINKKITQVGQTTVQIEVDEGELLNSDNAGYYTSNPPDTTVSSTGSTAGSASTTIPIAWTLTNASSDTQGFGLMLPNRPASNTFQIPDSYWYVQQAQVSDGAVTSSTTVAFDSVTNLIVGMNLVNIQDGSVSGSPVITAINGNTVTLSVAQTIGDNKTLYFRAYGPTLISQTFGLNIEFNNFVAKGTQLTKTVRTDTTFPETNSTVTVNVNGTYGIAGGSLVRATGFNINENGNNNLITTVSASSTAGSFNVTFQGTADDVSSSVVPVGTVLNINGSHQVIKVEGTVVINKYPSANQKLALDLTKFITHGAAS